MARRGRIPLSERVYRSLQRDLAEGVLIPTERLGEERLAEIYGVSRTPVREALARLQSDGLIERHPDGLYPYRPRLDELADLYELRILLESHGIHRQRTGDGAATAPLTRVHDAATVGGELEIWLHLRSCPPHPGAELIAADERFHSRLLAASGNAALTDALETVYARVRPVRALDMPTPDRIATMTTDHIAIAEQLLAGDLDKAMNTLVTHITTSRDHVLGRAGHALRLTKLARALRD
ncbi:GntR family transcriptional regulator [Nocardia uniformis]|uniref:GntR family transcriptional regulator n=1 Tax=Nocardia uniformis TaxID=53432 RepID=A0A849CAU9_9NOCA|nr:GntR family transcriptional regulator [Nocardia uniformis]NNH74838.1 GntR family transcriptional regulator [Nocardia uniformis]